MTQINSIPLTRKRTRKPPVSKPTLWQEAGTKLIIAIVAPMILTILLSLCGWIAFRATVVEKLDEMSTTVQEIKHSMVSKDYVDESLHGITDRLAADESDIILIRTQLHDDEIRSSAKH